MKLSVAIPAYNEEAYIQQTLTSLSEQEWSGELEIIVCLNACTDKTEEVIRRWSSTRNVPVRIIQEPHKGVSRARQTAFESATGEVILSADADAIYPRAWVTRIAQCFVTNPDVVALYGPVRLHDCDESSGFFLNGLQFVFNEVFTFFGRFVGWHNVIGSNLAIRRDVFEKIGGFDLTLGTMEDNEIARRLRRIGLVRYDAQMVAYASARRYNQFGFWRTVVFYFRNGIKGIFLNQKTEDLEDLRKS